VYNGMAQRDYFASFHFSKVKNMLKKFIASSLIAIAFAGCASRPTPNFTPAEPSLRAVTYNINWGSPKPEAVAKFLMTADADIICLQETHAQWETFLKSRLAKIYPHSYFHSARGAGGIAFMSKHPLNNTRPLKAADGWFPGLITEVESALGSVQVLNVHLRPPLSDSGSATLSAYYNSPDIHRKELTGFLKSANFDNPLIIAGDFNENEARAAVNELLSKGFTDALSMYDTESKTWAWKVFPGINLSNRYDHILFNRRLACTGAGVGAIDASDHRPVIAALVNNTAPAEP